MKLTTVFLTIASITSLAVGLPATVEHQANVVARDSVVPDTPLELPVLPDITDPVFQTVVLNTHNELRAIHGTPGLIWDLGLATLANDSVASCYWDKSGPGKLLSAESLVPSDFANATAALIADGWYRNGSIEYDYRLEHLPSGLAIYYFAQVVWYGTARVGCAWSDCSAVNEKPHRALFECHYDPPGPVNDDWHNNVHPPLRPEDPLAELLTVTTAAVAADIAV